MAEQTETLDKPAAPAGGKTFIGGTGSAVKQTTAGGSGGVEKPAARRKPRTGITTIYGTRTMKTYHVTAPELRHLFGIGLLAALLFSIATAALSYGFEISKDIDFNPEASKEVVDYWRTIQWRCWIGGAASLILSGIFLWLGNHNIGEIKRNTTFDGD